MPKPVAEKAKLGGSYSMLLTGILLQLSDKTHEWSPQQCISLGLMFIAVLLAKEYNNLSNCSEPQRAAGSPVQSIGPSASVSGTQPASQLSSQPVSE